MKFLFPTALLLLSFASAQPSAPTTPPKGGDLPSLPVPGGALLRLYFPEGGPVNAFKIVREGGGRSETLTSAVPAARETALANKWLNAKTYDLLKSVYVNGNTSLNKDPIAKFNLDLELVRRPDWARALGLIFSDTGLTNGTRYTYRVTASVRGRDLEIGRATVTPGPTPALAVPSTLKISPSGPRATLTFRAGSEETVGYTVLRGEGNAALTPLEPSPFFPNVTDDNRPPTFTDAKLKTDARYRYAVRAIDLFGRMSEPTAPVGVDMLEGQPLPQLALSTEAGDKVMKLRWAGVSDRRVTGLKVLRGSTERDLKEIARLPASSTSYEDRSGKGGTFYLYALAPVTKDGVADPDGLKREKFLNYTLPPAPTGVAVSFKDGVVRVTWTASKSDEVRGYVVLRSLEQGAPLSRYQAMNGTPVVGTALAQTLSGTAGASYTYRVQAVSTSERRSAPSEAAVLTLPAVGPLITLADVDAQPDGLTLEWTVSGGKPGGIEIFRQNPDGTLALIARLPGDAKTYTDKNVVMTKPYAYLAFALDAKGERVRPSNVVAASVPLRIELGAIQGLTASSGPGGVTVTWGRAKNAYSYLVYRIEDGKAVLLSSTREFRIVDTNGKAGVTYRVVPRAVNDISGEAAETQAR